MLNILHLLFFYNNYVYFLRNPLFTVYSERLCMIAFITYALACPLNYGIRQFAHLHYICSILSFFWIIDNV